jgi:hypothetical protein
MLNENVRVAKHKTPDGGSNQKKASTNFRSEDKVKGKKGEKQFQAASEGDFIHALRCQAAMGRFSRLGTLSLSK